MPIERVSLSSLVPYSKCAEIGLGPIAVIKTDLGNEYILTAKDCGYKLPKKGQKINTKLLLRKENVL